MLLGALFSELSHLQRAKQDTDKLAHAAEKCLISINNVPMCLMMSDSWL